jgi:hypothetical protein
MTRGGGKAFVFNGPFVTSGAGSVQTFIDLATWGAFVRDSSATFMDGASTSGNTQFIRDAARNVRRFEDRGDGNGKMLLLEGSRKNWFTHSETFASWSAGSASITNDYGPAPDGTTTADRLQVASGGSGANFSLSGITPSIDWVGTLYRRSPTGTVSAQDLIGASSVWPSANNSLGTTYERAVCAALPSNSSTAVGMWVADARDWSAFGGSTATEAAVHLASDSSPVGPFGDSWLAVDPPVLVELQAVPWADRCSDQRSADPFLGQSGHHHSQAALVGDPEGQVEPFPLVPEVGVDWRSIRVWEAVPKHIWPALFYLSEHMRRR